MRQHDGGVSRNRTKSRIETGAAVPIFQESRNVVPKRIVGYARVSKISQTIEQQVDGLRAIGASIVYADQGISGATAERNGLTAALRELHRGDVLAVVALDRLGRDLSDLIGIVDLLKERGADLHSVRESIDTTTASGRSCPAEWCTSDSRRGLGLSP